MKKIPFILLFVFLISCLSFSGDFNESLSQFRGQEIMVFIKDFGGSYFRHLKGTLEEIFSDHIVLSKTQKKGKELYFIKLEYITDFIVSEEE